MSHKNGNIDYINQYFFQAQLFCFLNNITPILILHSLVNYPDVLLSWAIFLNKYRYKMFFVCFSSKYHRKNNFSGFFHIFQTLLSKCRCKYLAKIISFGFCVTFSFLENTWFLQALRLIGPSSPDKRCIILFEKTQNGVRRLFDNLRFFK